MDIEKNGFFMTNGRKSILLGVLLFFASKSLGGDILELQHEIYLAVCQAFEDLQADPFQETGDHKQDVLVYYNQLRGMVSLPLVNDLEQIDLDWLDRQGYLIWKQLMIEYWQKKGISNLEEQGTELLASIHKSTDQNAFFPYNLLRELFHKPLARSHRDIDKIWLRQQEYSTWKSQIRRYWHETGLLLQSAQISHLLWLIEQNDHVSSNSALFAYNFLREGLHLPLAPSSDEIDRDWLLIKKLDALEGLKEAKDPVIAQEIIAYLPGAAPATFAQLMLINKTLRLLDLDVSEKLIALRHPSCIVSGEIFRGKATDTLYIALCDHHDLAEQVSTLYHELGHIASQDIPHHSDKRCEDFTDDLVYVQAYRKLGKTAFSTSTTLGKNIASILTSKPAFWVAPADREQYKKALIHRLSEKKADLFAVEHLLAQQQLSIIMHLLGSALASIHGIGSVTAKQNSHPSFFERLLYMAGFLVAHGVNIDQLLDAWLAHGTCSPFEIDGFLPSHKYF